MEFIFTRRYCMAHRLIEDVGGRCATPHGHNEFVKVRCAPSAEFILGPNMAMDFADAKALWHQWIDASVDHALQLSNTDPLIDYFLANEPHRVKQIMVTPGDPTTEMLVMLMARKFKAICGDSLILKSIEIEETPTNSVILEFPDNTEFMSMPVNELYWWDRADLTINNHATA